MKMMRVIRKENELDEAVSKNGIVVAKFGAAWCGPCDVLDKNIIEFMCEHPGDAEFIEIDVDDADEGFVDKYYLHGLPVSYFFKDGEKAYVVEGLMTKEQILERIDALKCVENVETLKHE